MTALVAVTMRWYNFKLRETGKVNSIIKTLQGSRLGIAQRTGQQLPLRDYLLPGDPILKGIMDSLLIFKDNLLKA